MATGKARREHPRFRTKSEIVHDSLRAAILSGELAPGERIDQETLAAQHDVSRMPLRQALLRLEAEGLLQMRPHYSAVVTPLSHEDVEELYAMRCALEAMLAAEGTRRRTDHDLEQMAARIADQEGAIAGGDIAAFVEHDRAFHRTLYHAAGYRSACQTVEQLRDRSDRYVRAWASHERGAERSIADHAALLEAVRDGDAERARAVTHAHIERALHFLVEGRRQSDRAATSPDAP